MTATDTGFDDFIAAAWNDHADQPAAVAQRAAAALDRPGNAAQAAALARLLTHVYGEHLGQWQQGAAMLSRLGEQPVASDPATQALLKRSSAALRHAGGETGVLDALGTDDRAFVLATAAGALAGRDEWARAAREYAQALEIADTGLSERSPSARALAIAGNNIAAALEQKPDRDADLTAAMIVAAKGALTYWRKAGTWLEEERAHYRLANSLLQAGRGDEALASARQCESICNANDAPPLERFFAHAMLASVARAQRRDADFAQAREQATQHFAALSEDDRGWCRAELERLGAAPA
jgi:hypothetical protein